MHIQLRRRRGGSRLSLAVLLGILGVGLSGASIAWACAPNNYGWDQPKAPAAEAPSANQGGGSGTQSPAPPSGGSGPAASQPSPSGGPESGTVSSPSSAPVNSPNSAPVRSPGRVRTQGPVRQPAAQSPVSAAPQVNAPSGVYAPATGSGPVSADGATSAGSGSPQVQSPDSGGERVGGRAEGSSGGGSAQAPTARSAAGDLWSAVEADRSSSLTPSGGDPTVAADSGPSAGFGVGLALLGLGAVGLAGGLAFAGARRRGLALRRDQ